MLMARVLIGNVLVGSPSMKPPYRSMGASGRTKGADSLADSTDEPLTFVIAVCPCHVTPSLAAVFLTAFVGSLLPPNPSCLMTLLRVSCVGDCARAG